MASSMFFQSMFIPSHDIAQLLLSVIREFLASTPLHDNETVEQICYIIVICAVALTLGYAIRLAVLFVTRKIIMIHKSQFWTDLMQQKVVTKCTHVIPPLVIMAFLPFAFEYNSSTLLIARRILFVYTTIMIGIGINAVIGFVWTNYNRHANKDNHPLKGVMNVAKGIVWIIITIVCASILVHRSPMALLGGLGAFAAALMLIFKDSILGFVSGIQLSSNDMLRVGDWIVVPSTIANGVVKDVSLTVVKVQNWDNTIVMLPPYTLVSTSFQNWRGMSESGVRQIDRSVIIDNTSIRNVDSEFLASISEKFPIVKDFINARIKAGGAPEFNGGVAPVNGTIDTNLGVFRAYMCQYLLQHPAISNDNNIIVRLMTPDANGTPLDIYCFTNTTDWLAYEAIRSQLFEHIAAMASEFGLRIFNATDAGRLSIASPALPSTPDTTSVSKMDSQMDSKC